MGKRQQLTATFMAILFIFLISVKGQANVTLTSLSRQLTQYSYFNLQFQTHLLPQNNSFSLEVTEQDLHLNSTIFLTVWSQTVTQQSGEQNYTIWNYQNKAKLIVVNLVGTQGTAVSGYLFKGGRSMQEAMFVSILDNDQTSGYLLPFNMLNVRLSRVFVTQWQATPVQRRYNLSPYMSTYWTENKITSSVMPWLPYFSECSRQKRYLLLNDLVLPSECSFDLLEELGCQNRHFDFQCIIEEYQVSSVSSEFWFNSLGKILFYLYPTQLTATELDHLINNQPLLNRLFSTYYNDLVPVTYRRISSHPVVINSFRLVIKLDLQGGKWRVVTAEMTGDYEPSILQPTGRVQVDVQYISKWSSFIHYNVSYLYYFLFALCLSLTIAILLRVAHRRLGIIQVREKFKFMVSPALKGVGYSILLAGGLTILTHLVAFYTSYSGIYATYDSNYSGEALEDNNKGRYGLTLLFTGVFVVMNGIRQAVKVNESEELKIALEDDKKEFESEEQRRYHIEFCKKNQISHLRYLFNSIFVCLVTAVVYFYALVQQSFLESLLIQLLLFPLLSRTLAFTQKKYFVKSTIFVCALSASFNLLPLYSILKNKDLEQLLLLYLTKYCSLFLVLPALHLLLDSLSLLLLTYRQHNRLALLLYSLFQTEVQQLAHESQYEKALSYSLLTVSQITTILLYPLIALIVLLTQQSTRVTEIFMITQPSLVVGVVVLVSCIPAEVYCVLVTVNFLKKNYGLRIFETIKFNHFKFMREKLKWMNDVSAQSKDIREEFRVYEKFAFSSQLYFVISQVVIGMHLMLLGIVTMLNLRYLPFYDPVTFIVLFIVWVIVQILSTVVSFAAVKLKLYERKEREAIRQKLGKVEKYLRVNETGEYLELSAVKDYFMEFNKDWIVANLDRIFSKEDFRQNNHELISLYKHYKSSFKRGQIAHKKRIQQEQINFSKLQQQGDLFQEQFRVVRNQRVFAMSQRICTYWYYLGKQNLFLKEIVNRVRKEQVKAVCEYCKMDVELQVLEKKEFHWLVNHYRTQNVGKVFDEAAFLEYYRLNQQFLTICLDCKEQNLHIESKINSKSKTSQIVFHWLLLSRSRLLHRTT